MTTDTAVLPSMSSPAPAPTPRPQDRLRRLGVDTAYTLTGLPVAIAAFVVVVTGLALGAGLLVVWVGVAVLAATLLAARGFATLERRRADDPVRRLTPREREVLGLIAEGHSNAAVARILVVTPGAVEKHTQHIFAKLGLAQDEDQHRRVMATLAYLRG